VPITTSVPDPLSTKATVPAGSSGFGGFSLDTTAVRVTGWVTIGEPGAIDKDVATGFPSTSMDHEVVDARYGGTGT
jgi:hypothetical protein